METAGRTREIIVGNQILDTTSFTNVLSKRHYINRGLKRNKYASRGWSAHSYYGDSPSVHSA